MEKANLQRAANGCPAMSLIGYAELPPYDKTNHKLYWAKELKVGLSQYSTLSYDIRDLGRIGGSCSSSRRREGSIERKFKQAGATNSSNWI
jgi:uncharacterized membrane-anchored protein